MEVFDNDMRKVCLNAAWSTCDARSYLDEVK